MTATKNPSNLDQLIKVSKETLQPFHSFREWPERGKDSFVISFEGLEGSGKSTQIKKLGEHFTSQGKQVVLLREPGGTPYGENLRKAILDSQTPLHPLAEATLFASSRAQLCFERILPALKKSNTLVLVDRYIDSSLLYQGLTRQLGLSTILQLHSFFPLHFFPDITFYLHITPELSLKRLDKRSTKKDYFESEKQEFFQQLYDGHEKLLELFPQRIKKMAGDLSETEVHQNIVQTWDTFHQ